MEFCPGCGKKSKGICKDCKPTKEFVVKDIVITLCNSKDRIYYKSSWKPFNDINKMITKIVKDSIKTPGNFEVKLDIPEFKRNPGVFFDFDITLIEDGDEYIIPGKIEVTYCDDEAKKQGNYYEGVMQFRNIDPEMKKLIFDQAKKMELYISKERKEKNGFDLQITKITGLIVILGSFLLTILIYLLGK